MQNDEAVTNGPEARRLWLEISRAVEAYTAYLRRYGLIGDVTIKEAPPVAVREVARRAA